MEIKKSDSPNYDYKAKGPQEAGKTSGAGKALPIEKKGGLSPIDQMSLSPKATGPVKTPLIDAPELFIPTPKAIRIASVKGEAAQSALVKESVKKTEARRTESKAHIEKEIKTNPWLMNKAILGALLKVTFEVLNNISTARWNESQIKQVVEMKMFEMGKENANLAKTLKDTAATKEIVRAVSSFVNAGMGAIQIASLAKAKGAAEAELGVKGGIGDKVNKQQEKIDYIKSIKDPFKANQLHQNDLNAFNQTNKNSTQPAPDRNDPKYNHATYDLPAETAKLDTFKNSYNEQLYRLRQEKVQIATNFGDMAKQLTEGAFGITGAVFTGMEGKLEKEKGMNDALNQMFNKLDESVNKSKDDFQSQFDKNLRDITEMIASIIKAHLLGRG